MCEICHQTPCNCRCPNAKEPIVGSCSQCNEDIRSDYTYWIDEAGNLFCSEECALKFYNIRET